VLRSCTLLLTTNVGGRGRHVVLRLISRRSLLSHRCFIDIDGNDFGEETIGVISEMIRASQDRLHGVVTLSQIVKLASLIDQKIFQCASVLVQDARSLNTEVVNDGLSCVAETVGAVRLGRRSLRGKRGL